MYITDSNGYVIARFDAEGLESVDLKILGRSLKELFNTDNNIISNRYTDKLYITDSNGYVIARFDAYNGLRTITRKNNTTKLSTNIVVNCWGDSLTAGAGGNGVKYSSVIESALREKYASPKVYNYGVGGENINTIFARMSSIVCKAAFEFVLKADGSKSLIADGSTDNYIKSMTDNSNLAPLLQGDGGASNIAINGIKCVLSRESTDDTENSASKSKWYINRTEKAENDITFGANSAFSMIPLTLFPHAINIIFAGQNGGYSSIDDFVSKVKRATMTTNSSRYIIVGLHSSSIDERAEQTKAFYAEFGNKFFDWGFYVSTSALVENGITPTSTDLEQMKEGKIPSSLLSDNVHLNEKGYTILGKALIKKMNELYNI